MSATKLDSADNKKEKKLAERAATKQPSLDNQIGEGNFSKVYSVVIDNRAYAVK
jgi:hypothetical protein